MNLVLDMTVMADEKIEVWPLKLTSYPNYWLPSLPLFIICNPNYWLPLLPLFIICKEVLHKLHFYLPLLGGWQKQFKWRLIPPRKIKLEGRWNICSHNMRSNFTCRPLPPKCESKMTWTKDFLTKVKWKQASTSVVLATLIWWDLISIKSKRGNLSLLEWI